VLPFGRISEPNHEMRFESRVSNHGCPKQSQSLCAVVRYRSHVFDGKSASRAAMQQKKTCFGAQHVDHPTHVKSVEVAQLGIFTQQLPQMRCEDKRWRYLGVYWAVIGLQDVAWLPRYFLVVEVELDRRQPREQLGRQCKCDTSNFGAVRDIDWGAAAGGGCST